MPNEDCPIAVMTQPASPLVIDDVVVTYVKEQHRWVLTPILHNRASVPVTQYSIAWVGTSGGGELDQNVVESPSDWLQPGISYPKTREKFLVGLEVLPHDLQEQLRPDPDDDTMVIYMIVDAQLSDGTHFSAAQEYKALRKRFGLDADYPSDLHPEPGTLPN